MDKLVIGLVRTSHGVRGNMKVTSFSGEFKHFLSLQEVVLRLKGREKSFVIESVTPMGDNILLKLEGIENPEDAKSFAGAEILVPREQAAPLKKGEFYQADLVGCQLVHQGKVLGDVKSMFQGGASDLLEVVTEEGTFFVPFQSHYIGDVDLDKKTIELTAPWLLQ